MERTDYLIIGAGPSGSAAAIALKNEGKDCILVDKATFPRVKLCGGLFTGKAQDALAALVGKEKYADCMSQCTASRETKFSLWQTEKSPQTGEPVRQRMLVEVRPRKEIVLIDRPRFDEWMVRHYQSLGGTLIEGDGIASIDFANHTAHLESGRTIAYRTMIAADGANSTVERLLAAHRANGTRDLSSSTNNPSPSAPKNHKKMHTRGNALCLEINVDRADCPDADGVQIHFGIIPQSYAWSFSKGDKVCLGLVKKDNVQTNPHQAFRHFLHSLGVHNIDRYPLRGAMLPFGNYMPHPAYVFDAQNGNRPNHTPSILFVGDAARLVEPLTGEGIFYALQSGILAAQSHGDPTQYMHQVSHLHQLISKGDLYQHWLMHNPLLHSLLCRQASHHPSFIEHFYSTQIEQPTLDSFLKIVWKYKRGK